jgi:hypothetical protein
VSLRFWGKNDNNNGRIFHRDFHATLGSLSVCECAERKGKRERTSVGVREEQLEKKYPPASRQIDFSQVLSAFRISCSREPRQMLEDSYFLHNGSAVKREWVSEKRGKNEN